MDNYINIILWIYFKNISDWTVDFYRIFGILNVRVGKLRKESNSRYYNDAYTFTINTYDYCSYIGFGIERKRRLSSEFLRSR